MRLDNEDNLIHLLRRADADSQPPGRVSDLATRVRRRQGRRQKIRAGAATVAVIAVFAGLGWHVRDGNSPPRPAVAHNTPAPSAPVTVSVAAIRSTLDQLERECALREAAVDRMLSSRRQRAAASDPLLELAWQREQAALVLVRQGDRLSDDLKLPRAAVVAYRQARDTFPGTHWAAVAEARLGQSELIQ